MIEVDGSYLEGGGQILRTSLALSAVFGEEVRIKNVRANRPKKGLMPQHLTVVNALREICNAEVEGNILNSTEVVFKPSNVEGGKYEFDIGTAGSVTLFIQALLPVLIHSDEDFNVIIKGGTHVMKSPSFEYMKYCFIENVKKMGVRADVIMERPGFYPKGGGVVELKVLHSKIKKYDFIDRGKHMSKRCYIVLSKLPEHIYEREKKYIESRIDAEFFYVNKNGLGPGNAITLISEYERYNIGVDVLGRVGKPAEKVARDVVNNYLREESLNGVDLYMLDQILIYMALAGSGRVRYNSMTNHARTNMYTISKFTGREFDINEEEKIVYY